MELARLMMQYYMNTAVRSFKLTIRNWQAMIAPVMYLLIIYAVSIVAVRLSVIGGIIYAVAVSACIGSWLYMVETIINNRTVTFEDFKYSFKPYLARVINVTFYIWLALLIYDMIINRIFRTLEYWQIINKLIYICGTVALNPLPELIYQTYHPEIQLYRDSVEFVGQNFLEWTVPNVIFAVLLAYLFGGSKTFMISVNVLGILKYVAGSLVFMYVMIYRGILFRFLNESTPRSRLFKLKMLMRS